MSGALSTAEEPTGDIKLIFSGDAKRKVRANESVGTYIKFTLMKDRAANVDTRKTMAAAEQSFIEGRKHRDTVESAKSKEQLLEEEAQALRKRLEEKDYENSLLQKNPDLYHQLELDKQKKALESAAKKRENALLEKLGQKAEIDTETELLREARDAMWDERKKALTRGAITAAEATASLGAAAYLAKNYIIPFVQTNESIRNGVVVIRQKVYSLTKGLQIPTLAGKININLPTPDWLAGSSAKALTPRMIWDPSSTGIDSFEPRIVAPDSLAANQEGQKPTSEGTDQIREIPISDHISTSIATVEGRTPISDTGGFWQYGGSSRFELVPDTTNGFIQTSPSPSETFKNAYVPFAYKKPAQYVSRETITAQLPDQKWVAINVRPGERPIAYSGLGAESPAIFRQNEKYGNWEVYIKGKKWEENITIYTDKAREEDLSYLNRLPDTEDFESMIDTSVLRPDMLAAITAINEANLTPTQKIEEGLALWRQVYAYDKVAPRNDIPMDDTKKYITWRVNDGVGPCGYAAMGAAAILRELWG